MPTLVFDLTAVGSSESAVSYPHTEFTEREKEEASLVRNPSFRPPLRTEREINGAHHMPDSFVNFPEVRALWEALLRTCSSILCVGREQRQNRSVV
jgi:hypothetical protein